MDGIYDTKSGPLQEPLRVGQKIEKGVTGSWPRQSAAQAAA